MDKEERCVFV